MLRSDEKTKTKSTYKNAFLFIRHPCMGNMTRLYLACYIFVSMNIVVNTSLCTMHTSFTHNTARNSETDMGSPLLPGYKMIILPKIKAKFFKKVESFEKLYYDPTKSKIKKKH